MNDTDNQKPDSFKMQIQGGMLEALGINMYTSLGKCLVEFVANAYDSNSPEVEINIPFEQIETERDALRKMQKEREAARKAAEKAEALAAAAAEPAVSTDAASSPLPIISEPHASDRGADAESRDALVDGDPPSKSGGEAAVVEVDPVEVSTITVALPDVSTFDETLGPEVTIVIKDFGHGMSPSDVALKFLPLNRRRRKASDGKESEIKSEGGRRHVMGRKGLGKLAGFGTAQKIVIRTKREGDSYYTIFELDSQSLRTSENLGEIPIPARYEEGAPVGEHGTTITLSGLKPGAVKSSQERINTTLAEAFFGIQPEEFKITLNGNEVKETGVDYEFWYPEKVKETKEPVVDYITLPDLGSLRVEYLVKFRERKHHLTASRIGGRIYCNKRLAAGPSLFKLPSGMHNFHGADYMEGIFIIDDLDRLGIDFVNTNRTQLREDNDVVDSVLQYVSKNMQAAIAAHGKFRDGIVEEQIEENETGKAMKRAINGLPKRSRKAATKLLNTIGARFGVDSDEFKTMAPLVVQSVNAGEVLVELIKLADDPGTIEKITRQLAELAEIEKADALKLYRGRKNGIIGLSNLIQKGEDLWKKKGIEKELHALLKREPWLLKPEYSKYVTSDVTLTKLSSRIAQILGVDDFSPMAGKDGEPDAKRPDLVFVMSDAATPHVFHVVELKSPSIPLDITHLHQLQGYLSKVENYIKTELSGKATVIGYLVGAMPDSDPKKRSDDQETLLHAIEKEAQRGGSGYWEVIGLDKMLQRARTIHSDAIDALEEELSEKEEDGEGDASETGKVETAKSVADAAIASAAAAAFVEKG